MNTLALLYLLAEAVPLSTFPFIFYWLISPIPTSSRNPTLARSGKGIIALVCLMGYLFVTGFYFFAAFGTGMGGGYAGPYPLNRLLQHPLQAPVSLIVFPLTAAGLALAKKGTLGLWAFAIGAGFISYWAGLGWLPAEMDWLFVIVFAIIGGLSGVAAGFIVSRVSQPQERSGLVRLWAAVGAGSADIGMLAGWLGVQAVMHRSTFLQADPMELRPFSINPGVMLPLLLIVVAIWLTLSVFVAIVTGLYKARQKISGTQRGN